MSDDHTSFSVLAEHIRRGRRLNSADAAAVARALEAAAAEQEFVEHRWLLRYDSATLSVRDAAAWANVSPDTAIRRAKRLGICHQMGGRGGTWRIHPAAWALSLAGDDEGLEDLKAGRPTEAVRRAYAEIGVPMPDQPKYSSAIKMTVKSARIRTGAESA